jgi:hypothetical protein
VPHILRAYYQGLKESQKNPLPRIPPIPASPKRVLKQSIQTIFPNEVVKELYPLQTGDDMPTITLYKLEVDYYVPKYNLAFEYYGEHQYFGDFK